MTAYSFNIIFTIYVSFIVHSSHGFKVIQPQNRTVNSDWVASISCEHTANVSSVEDVRLNSISLTGKRTMLCQKGKKNCDNIVMHEVNNKWLFILFNIGPEDMNNKYECEITVIQNNLDETMKGIPTILQPGEKEVACVRRRPPPPPSPPPSPPPPASPPPPPPHTLQCHLRWILIGLLTLMFLYSCVITFFYFRLRSSNSDPENSVYVEMRKAPLPRNQPFDIYCG